MGTAVLVSNLIKKFEDEPDNVANLALGDCRLLPRLLLPRQLGQLHIFPCLPAAEGTACYWEGLHNQGTSCVKPLPRSEGGNKRPSGNQTGLGVKRAGIHAVRVSQAGRGPALLNRVQKGKE